MAEPSLVEVLRVRYRWPFPSPPLLLEVSFSFASYGFLFLRVLALKAEVLALQGWVGSSCLLFHPWISAVCSG